MIAPAANDVSTSADVANFRSGDRASSERLAAVFRERAERLAARETTRAARVTTPMLVFELTPERYAVELANVMQVMPLANCTPIPGAPASLLGVINLRGDIRSVVDLRQILQLPNREPNVQGYLIVLRHADRVVGARVDQVHCVQGIELAELIEPSPELRRLHGAFVKGIDPDMRIVLDAAAIFSHAVFKTNSSTEK
ncbi:MAG TPA: chemotaxis protein CheW [Pirellulales bacterium]|nr:chemotaxis protein CheW [Pirellulales bacterium]